MSHYEGVYLWIHEDGGLQLNFHILFMWVVCACLQVEQCAPHRHWVSEAADPYLKAQKYPALPDECAKSQQPTGHSAQPRRLGTWKKMFMHHIVWYRPKMSKKRVVVCFLWVSRSLAISPMNNDNKSNESLPNYGRFRVQNKPFVSLFCLCHCSRTLIIVFFRYAHCYVSLSRGFRVVASLLG